MLSAADGPESRAEIELKEKARWAYALAEALYYGEYPILASLSDTQDPWKALTLQAGGTRPRTIRSRLLVHTKFDRWTRVRRLAEPISRVLWPYSIAEVLDYLRVRAAEPCGRAVPQTVMISLSYVEKSGNVEDEDRVAAHKVVQRAVDYHTIKLNEGATPTKKA